MLSFFKLNTTEKDLPYILFYDTGLESVSGHWHKEMEIVLCHTGTTEMTINNRKYTLHAGEIGVALGGDIHAYTVSSNHRRTIIIFDLSMFEYESMQPATGGSLRRKLKNMERFSGKWDKDTQKRAADIITYLERLNETQKFGRSLDIWARLCDLVLLFCNKVPENAEMGRQLANYNQVKTLEGLEKVFSFVEQNYNRRITLNDAAEVMSFNPSYFARAFHRITGTTFLTYLNTYRVNRARQQLINDDKIISEISSQVGFGSVKTFNRVFKQIIGVSPTDYRKNAFNDEGENEREEN